MLSTAIIRKTIPPDLIVTPQNVPVGDPVIFIPFYYLDKRTGGTDNNANMIGPAGTVGKEGLLTPGIVDNITGQGKVIIILLPASHLRKQFNLPLAATFRRNNIGFLACNGCGADKDRTPAVGILDGIVLGQRFVGIVEVNNFLVTSVCFIRAQPLLGGSYERQPRGFFRGLYISGKSPGVR